MLSISGAPLPVTASDLFKTGIRSTTLDGVGTRVPFGAGKPFAFVSKSARTAS